MPITVDLIKIGNACANPKSDGDLSEVDQIGVGLSITLITMSYIKNG